MSKSLPPDGLVSHTSQHPDLSVFRGSEVAVIGAGQSALESAALLHEAGARAQVLVRGQARWGVPPRPPRQGLAGLLPEPDSPLGDTWRIYRFSLGPAAFRYLPVETRRRLVKRVLGPFGAWWLKDRVVGQVPVLDRHQVVSAQREGDKVQLTVASAAGQQELAVDHVLATGYRVEPEPPGLPCSRAGRPGAAGGAVGLPRPRADVRVLGSRVVLHQPDRGRDVRAGHALRRRCGLCRAPGERGSSEPHRVVWCFPLK